MAMKIIDGEERPAGNFLVVEDPEMVSTWNLPVKVNGVVDRRLAGAAWAALFSPGGYRGNKYEGAMKNEAKRKLKALYDAEGWDMPVSESEDEYEDEYEMEDVVPYGVMSFADLDAASQAAEVSERLQKRAEQFFMLFWRIYNSELLLPEKRAAWDNLFGEFKMVLDNELVNVSTEQPVETMGSAEIAEAIISEDRPMEDARNGHSVTGQAVRFVERENGDAPAYIDFVPVSPGWGNRKDNHYYALDMLVENASVWQGAKMWASDHRQDEKNALNQISEVIKSPAGFTSDGVPYARAVILNKEFEDIVRRRAEAGILDSLHCSILANGKVRKGKYEKDGRNGLYVESIDGDGAMIDWVTRAGAGGRALRLAESDTEVTNMAEETKEVQQDAEVIAEAVIEVENVRLSEDHQEGEAIAEVVETNEPVFLTETEIGDVIGGYRLPVVAKERLSGKKYQSIGELQEAIDSELQYIKELTGSGKPFAGQATRLTGKSASLKEVKELQTDVNKRWGFGR